MKLIEKAEREAGPVHLSWDAAQAALASGAYEVAPPEGERDADQPAAQMPAPGTDPKDGKESAAEGQLLTNMVPGTAAGTVASGLPKSPAPLEPAPAKAPATPAPAPQPAAAPVPAPAKSA